MPQYLCLLDGSPKLRLCSHAKKFTMAEYAKVFIGSVFRFHGMPKAIISNKDPRFVGKFLNSIPDVLETDLKCNTAAHPGSNSQWERLIQTTENSVQPCIKNNSHVWTNHLIFVAWVAKKCHALNYRVHSVLSAVKATSISSHWITEKTSPQIKSRGSVRNSWSDRRGIEGREVSPTSCKYRDERGCGQI